MKQLLAGIATFSLVLVLEPARMVFAGVVMAETSLATGPDGQTKSQTKTVYLQGNKRRVERQDIAAITDLDKSIVYIVDKQHRAYAEIPLEALSAHLPHNGPGQSVKLDRTGRTRTIANHACSEYRATQGDKLEHVTISACVATDAPGAKELSQFDHKMLARLGGSGSDPAPNQADALMLEKQSVVSFRIPDPSQHQTYRTASLSAETRVDQIRLMALPPETFKPPRGFSQLHNRPGTAPPLSPQITGRTLEVIGPGSPGGSRASL